jgi:hypothetical protein
MSQMRTDKNRNPTAFTVDIAKEAGLVLGTDYEQGDPFEVAGTHALYTAKLLGDPIAITIRVIDKIGFFNSAHNQRWAYVAIFYGLWMALLPQQKLAVIKDMYQREGGTEMAALFAGADYNSKGA